MKILLATSESTDLASTGGLGDVGQALPLALHRAGVHCDRIMPLYRMVRERCAALEDTGIRLQIPLAERQVDVAIFEHRAASGDGPRTFLIANDELFDRPSLYGTAEDEFSDNAERFMVFQKAIIAFIDHQQCPYDIVHANDWQTGMLPLLLSRGIHGTERQRRERCLITIHNLAFQGLFPREKFALSNLPEHEFEAVGAEFYGQFNFFKVGLSHADRINTVSPTYAREIQSDPLGVGLDPLLRERADVLSGILNGVDYSAWDPATDPHLPANYGPDDLSGKQQCREALLREMRLHATPGQALLGLVSRLADQKGLELFDAALPDMLATGARFVLLGTGQQNYHEQALHWQQRWPDQVAVRLTFDIALAHRIEAGADIFLMPSRYEPCGLNQMYSLKYGTPPVVNATGGLEDTVEDGHTGFKLRDYSSHAFAEATLRAISHFEQPEAWDAMRRRVMQLDFSWDQSALAYRNLYQDMLT